MAATNWLDHSNCWLYLTDPTRSTRYRIASWLAFDATKDEHDLGSLSITVPGDVPWASNAAGAGFDLYDGWEQWSLDLYLRRTGVPIWSGPIVSSTLTPGPSLRGAPTVTLLATTFLQHFATRRRYNSATYADIATTDYPEDIIRKAFRDACGDVVPTGYPGGLTRAEFGTGWTVDGAADVGTVSPTIALHEQEGGLLLDTVRHIADKGDCYLYASETRAATWSLTTARPYQDTDTTSRFVLTPVRGSVTEWQLEKTVLDLLNVVGIKGDGSGAGQIKGYQYDAASVAARGVYEGEGTLPAASSTTYTDTEATRIVELHAEPHEAVEVALRDVTGAQFYGTTSGQHYELRDLVRIDLPTVGAQVDAVVRGWTVAQSGTGPFEATMKLGNLRLNALMQAVDVVGYVGPRLGGNRWRNNDG